jgi:hypothetical protein
MLLLLLLLLLRAAITEDPATIEHDSMPQQKPAPASKCTDRFHFATYLQGVQEKYDKHKLVWQSLQL